MDRGTWWATVYAVTELDMTEHTHTHMHTHVLSFTTWASTQFLKALKCRDSLESLLQVSGIPGDGFSER